MKSEIQEELLQFIMKNYMVERDEIELDKSLIDTGIIDSTGLIEISAFMESQFGISVEQDHMNRDNFGSVLKMVDYISGQKNNG